MSTEREAFEAARAEGHLWAYDDFCAGFEAGKSSAAAPDAQAPDLLPLINAYGRACRRDGNPAWESREGQALKAALSTPPAAPTGSDAECRKNCDVCWAAQDRESGK